MTIADLANRADVSQPTVTRFCRSVGCASFSEFKISLATTLTVAAAYLKSDRVFDDDIGHLAQTIMMRAAGAVRECLDQLDTAALEQAIECMATSRRIDLYGQGGGSAVDDRGHEAAAVPARHSGRRLYGRPPAAHVGGDAPAGRCRVRHLQQRPLQAGGRGGRDRALLRRSDRRPHPARNTARQGRRDRHCRDHRGGRRTCSCRRRRAMRTWR